MNVIYYPQFINEIDYSKLGSKEQNLFFLIVSKLKYTNEISLRADEIRDIISTEKKKATYKQAEQVAKNLIANFPQEIESFFDLIQVDYADKENKEFDGMFIVCYTDYQELFYILENKYTSLDLDYFCNITSVYTKTIFRLIHRYRYTGLYVINFEELKAHLNLRDKEYFWLNQHIFKPALATISDYFKNINIEKDGRNIKFYFDKIIKNLLPNEYHKLKQLHTNLTKDIGTKLLANGYISDEAILELATIEAKLANYK